MKRQFNRFCIFLFLCCVTSSVFAQDDVATRARFINDFTKGKYIEWPEKKGEFKVVILSDSVLFAQVSKLTSKKSLFKKNRVKVISSYTFPAASSIDIGLIYVNNAISDRSMASIIELYKGKPVLVVGENYPYHQSMINFVTLEGKLTFEMNKELLEAQGLKATSDLTSLAAQSETQWSKLLAETEAKYKQEQQLNQQKVNKAYQRIESLNKNLVEKDKVLSSTSDTLLMTRDELDKRTAELMDEQARAIRLEESHARQRQFNIFLIVGISLTVILMFFAYRSYIVTKRAKIQLADINKDLKRNKDELFFQKQLVDEKQKEITDSIKYALRIQRSMLPPVSAFEKLLPEHFLYYQPKDIVSGDFYWIEQVEDMVLFGVIDCTGHGVPGALMSVVGMNVLNTVVREKGITDTSLILNELDKGVQLSLRQYADDSAKDGMDLAICCLNKNSGELTFSGAFNPCWIVSSASGQPVLNEVKGDMKSIGVTFGNTSEGYRLNRIRVNKGDCIYLFSDGFPDQFGGPMGKKFKTSKLRELFSGMNNMSMTGQRDYLQRTFEDWKKDYDQIDDVCVMGVRI